MGKGARLRAVPTAGGFGGHASLCPPYEAWPLSLSVVAGLVPATPIILALFLNIRGRLDKPGDDADL